nr:putative ribonuclease H-like domain-containing protein [Tanacetum cinerariifolium]
MLSIHHVKFHSALLGIKSTRNSHWQLWSSHCQRKFPLPSKESSHCEKKNDATAEKIALLLKSNSNCQSKSNDSYTKLVPQVTLCILEIDQQNLTLAKIPILDTGKFEQWQFRIQQYLQHDHYALWEVIEFGDSYEAPAVNPTTGSASDGTGKKKGRTVTLTADDMQKRKNDVKARTTLLLSLSDEHQLRFSKYKTAQELWDAILKTFGEIDQDDLNQKFLTSLAPEWLMHMIVWRNRSDLDTMSLDDMYNHLKVYESEVQKKSKPNSQNMVFISSAKHSSGNEEVNIASGSIASINVSTASANIGVASISQDTACAYIASQSSDVAGFDKSKVECFNCHKMGHFARECRAPRSQDRGRRDNYRKGSKVKEQTPKALMEIDGDLELLKKEKGELVTKLTSFQIASKDLDSLLESQRLDKNKEGLGYSVVPPPPAQIYSPPKKDMSWTGLPKFKDDIACYRKYLSPTKSKTDKVETAKKPPVKFTWTFFLKTKDETSGILRKFITEIENLKDLKVKIIRCDNGGEFRNKEINDFCLQKGIKREFSNARTPQQNGVAEWRNRTLIEAARTMLADAKLPVTFWAEAVNTACYVLLEIGNNYL